MMNAEDCSKILMIIFVRNTRIYTKMRSPNKDFLFLYFRIKNKVYNDKTIYLKEDLKMEENRNESKRGFKEFMKDLWDENKLVIILGGAYAGGLALYLLGLAAGSKADGEAMNVGEALLHRDGFIKFFDPDTGLEINGTQARELTKVYYKNKKI